VGRRGHHPEGQPSLAQARVPRRQQGLLRPDDGQRIKGTHGRPHRQGVIKIHRGFHDDHRRSANGVRSADDRTQVPRVAQLDGDKDQQVGRKGDVLQCRLLDAHHSRDALRLIAVRKGAKDLGGQRQPSGRLHSLDKRLSPLAHQQFRGIDQRFEGGAQVQRLFDDANALNEVPALARPALAVSQRAQGLDLWILSTGDPIHPLLA